MFWLLQAVVLVGDDPASKVYVGRKNRYSYMMLSDPTLPVNRDFADTLAVRVSNAWYRFDHQTGKVNTFSPGPDSGLSEMCFVPRRKDAPEGDGYLVGVCSRNKENRSDLLIVDAQHLEDGPVATVKLPYRATPQVHGFWVGGYELPTAKG